jgi:hypothetical protein
MRDIQTDWKYWSQAERIAASMLMVLVTFAAGALLYIQT